MTVGLQRFIQAGGIVSTNANRDVVCFPYDDYWCCPVRKLNRRNYAVVFEMLELRYYFRYCGVGYRTLRTLDRTYFWLDVKLHLRFGASAEGALENFRKLPLELFHGISWPLGD